MSMCESCLWDYVLLAYLLVDSQMSNQLYECMLHVRYTIGTKGLSPVGLKYWFRRIS